MIERYDLAGNRKYLTGAERHAFLAAAALAAVPILIAFLLFQKHLIKGISLTGLAGR